MHLHGPVRGFAAQAVGPIVAHGHLVRLGEGALLVHQPGGLVDQRPQHLALGLQFHQWELNALVGGQRFAEGLALLGVLHGFVDAELRRAQAGGGLADAVLVEEVLHHLQAATLAAEDGVVRHPHVGQGDAAVVRGHVEGPEHFLDLEALGVGGRQEGGDALPVPGLAAGAGHDHVVLGPVDAGVPGLGAVYDPVVAFLVGLGLHVGGVGAVLRLGDAEGEAAPPFGQVVDPLRLLLLGAVLDHQQKAHVVADDGVLGLQVVVQAEALDRQMLADDGHAQIGAVPPAVGLGGGVAVVAGGVRAMAGLHHQPLPTLVGQAAALPVGAGVLAPMVEEADVVVLPFQGLDLPFDEVVKLC